MRLDGLPVKDVAAYGQRGSHGLLDVIIKQIQVTLRAGKVFFPSPRYADAVHMDWLGDASRALLMYPRALHDDIPRAFIQLLYETMLGLQTDFFILNAITESMAWGEPTGERLIV